MSVPNDKQGEDFTPDELWFQGLKQLWPWELWEREYSGAPVAKHIKLKCKTLGITFALNKQRDLNQPLFLLGGFTSCCVP